MACIDADGNITRTGELILLAMNRSAAPDRVAKACNLPLFRIRGAIREFVQAGLAEQTPEGLYRITEKGIRKLEGG